MRDDDAARVEVKLVLDAARKIPVLGLEIFRVADDGMSDMGGMGAELVGASGHRPHREPGERLACLIDHRIEADRVARVIVAVTRDLHPLADGE